jgi:hypothetical protein
MMARFQEEVAALCPQKFQNALLQGLAPYKKRISFLRAVESEASDPGRARSAGAARCDTVAIRRP